jgi:hypothetical protein
LLSSLRGRPAHLILLDAPREAAEAGQRARGRMLPRSTMDREGRRWARLLRRGARGEGWSSVTVLDRATAARIDGLQWQENKSPGDDRLRRGRSWGWLRVEVPEAS